MKRLLTMAWQGGWKEGGNLVRYVAIRGYGTPLTQPGKVLSMSVQSVLRGVERGEQEFQKRGWAIADFLN